MVNAEKEDIKNVDESNTNTDPATKPSDSPTIDPVVTKPSEEPKFKYNDCCFIASNLNNLDNES